MMATVFLAALAVITCAQEAVFITTVANQPWINLPSGLAIDDGGNLYIANSGGANGASIVMIAANNSIKILAGGPTNTGVFQDGVNNIGTPYGIGLMPNGDIIYSDGQNMRVRRVTLAGVVSTIASGFVFLHGLDVDKNGTIYVMDRGAKKVYRIVNGSVDLFVGGGAGTFTDGTSSLENCYGLKIGLDNRIYLGERTTLRIRVITRSGIVSSLSVSHTIWARPENTAFDGSGSVFVFDRTNGAITKVTNGIPSIFISGNRPDNVFVDTFPQSLSEPVDGLFDQKRNFYISDGANNRILRATICNYYGSTWNWVNRTCDCITGYTFDTELRRCIPICALGQYSSGGVCKPCPPNSECLAKSFICKSGFQYNATIEACESCTGNMYKSNPGNDPCIFVPINAVSTGSSFECQPGYQLHNDSQNCVPCLYGEYKKLQGNTPCLKCPPNSVCNNGRDFSCDIGFEPDDSNPQGCQSCRSGTYKAAVGNSNCKKCPPNSKCTSTMFVCDDGNVYDILSDRCNPDVLADAFSTSIMKTDQSDTAPIIFNLTVWLIAGAVFGLFLMLITAAYCLKKKGRTKSQKRLLESTEMMVELPTELISLTSDMMSVTLPGGHELSIPAFLHRSHGTDYALNQLIAKGGFGKVYLCSALDKELCDRAKGAPLVCKLIDIPNQRARYLFLQELSIMWFFRDHENFVKLYAFSENPAALVMKFYPADLDRLIFNRLLKPEYSKKIVIQLLKQVCAAIGVMHDSGFAHCDIKPANILLDYSRDILVPILTDFGISRVLKQQGVESFKIADVRGVSIRYASPEALGQMKKNFLLHGEEFKFCDVYSIALTLYEMLTRVSAWNGPK